MRKAILLLLLSASSLFAQSKPAGPPDQFMVHSDTWMVLEYSHGVYAGLGEGGTFEQWTFHIVAWEPHFIALAGVSAATDFEGRHRIAVLSGAPEGEPANALHTEMHIILGDKVTSRPVTVTWDTSFADGEAAADFRKSREQ